ncbi:unnamed protein product [Withania somnifera]
MESSRISLRPFRLTDADDILLWAGDDRVTQNIRWETLRSKEEALNFIKEVCIPQPWHVSICIDDRSIGFLWVVYPSSDKDIESAYIGYAIAAEYWGQGIATKALKMAILQILSDFPQIKKLDAYAGLENKASHRVLEKAGFLYQGTVFHGVDFVVYTLQSINI